ncbi:MAG: hypothetical protein HFJ84_09480 [Clostridiales bacterium]|nr:hypothetical protein [Clostridiales bacterium]
MLFSYIYERHGDKHFGTKGKGTKWRGNRQLVLEAAVAYLQQHENDMEAFRSIQDDPVSLSCYIVDDIQNIEASAQDKEDAFIVQVNMVVKNDIHKGNYIEVTYHLYPQKSSEIVGFGIGKSLNEAIQNSKSRPE